MKKIFVLFLLFVVSCLFLGCSGSVSVVKQSAIPAEVAPVDVSRFEEIEWQYLNQRFGYIMITTVKDKQTNVEYLIVSKSDGIAITPILTGSSVVDE